MYFKQWFLQSSHLGPIEDGWMSAGGALYFGIKVITWNAFGIPLLSFYAQRCWKMECNAQKNNLIFCPIALVGGALYGAQEELLVGVTLSAHVCTEETNHTVILNTI